MLVAIGALAGCVAGEGVAQAESQTSNTCTDANANVIDGYVNTYYVALRIQKNPSDAQETWICYRVWETPHGDTRAGGRVDLRTGSISAGPPVIESDSQGCSVTPLNTTVGDPGNPAYGPYLVGVDSSASQVRACFQVGSFQRRVTLPVPSASVTLPVVHQDPPVIPDPNRRQGQAGLPSTTCTADPTASDRSRWLNMETAGGTWASVYTQPDVGALTEAGEIHVCVRVEGPVNYGGLLTIRTSTGIAPVLQGPVPDTAPSPCTSNVITNSADPVPFSIRRSPGTSNPTSICVSVGSTGPFAAPGQRFTVGTSGAASLPVTWTPDPGTPG